MFTLPSDSPATPLPGRTLVEHRPMSNVIAMSNETRPLGDNVPSPRRPPSFSLLGSTMDGDSDDRRRPAALQQAFHHVGMPVNRKCRRELRGPGYQQHRPCEPRPLGSARTCSRTPRQRRPASRRVGLQPIPEGPFRRRADDVHSYSANGGRPLLFPMQEITGHARVRR
jgi:hypothetical protein